MSRSIYNLEQHHSIKDHNSIIIMSSFTRFHSLPTELKLSILLHADLVSLTRLLKTSKELRELALQVIEDKVSQVTGLLHHGRYLAEQEEALLPVSLNENCVASGLTRLSSPESQPRSSVFAVGSTNESALSNHHHSQIVCQKASSNIQIGIFSPQNAENKVELYETKCLSSSTSSSTATSMPVSRTGSSEDLTKIQELKQEQEHHEVNSDTLHDLDQLLTSLSHQHELHSTSTYRHTSHSVENMYTCFQIGSLVKTRNPLTQTTTSSEETDGNAFPMTLLVDEDSNNIKLTIQLSLSNGSSKKIFEKSEIFKTEWAQDLSQLLVSEKKKFGLVFKLTKGEEVPPRSPYDYETVTNYYLDVDNFMISNCYLLKFVEEAGISI